MQTPAIRPALVLYVSACSLSLIFCLLKVGHASMDAIESASRTDLGNSVAAERSSSTAMFSSSSKATSSSVSGGGGGEFVGVLESLLQTQLGVFVFSNFVIACCAAVAAITTSVFLEALTPSEAGRLTQRLLKYLLFKVALVGMVVLPKEVTLLHWLPWLGAIGEMKMFLGLAKDRLAGLSVTPTVGFSRHVRTLCLLGFILGANALGLTLLHRHQGALSWAISLLFALDLGVITVEATKAALSCVSLLMDEALAVHTPSLLLPATLGGRAIAVWDSWQGKGRERFFYHTELFADMAVHVLTLVHHMHVWLLHGMSFHLLDALLLLDTRVVVMSFVQRVRAHMRHRAATHSLDHTFPDATEKTLLADDSECAICRDKLSVAKQLPCGHLFHLPCLRAWLQQSGHDNFKCPICRRGLCVQRAHGTAGAGSESGGRIAGGGAGAGGGHGGWGGVGGHQRSAGGIMGTLSFSMSYNDLNAAARGGGGGGHMSLEEQLLLQQMGFAEEAAAAAAQDEGRRGTNNNQLAARNSGGGAGGGGGGVGMLGAMGSSDAEGFDSLLVQAIAASLQTAELPAAAAPLGDTADAGDDAVGAQQQWSAQSSAPGLARSGNGSSTSLHAEAASAQHDAQHGDAAHHQDQQQDLQLRQHKSAPAHHSSASGAQQQRRASRTSSLPTELLSFVGLQHGGGGSSSAQQLQQQLRLQDEDRWGGAGSSSWSDPLSDSDATLNSCPDSYSVRDTCSRMLRLISSNHGSSSKPAAAAAAGARSAGGLHASTATGGRDQHTAAAASTSNINNNSSSQLVRRHRSSRSCSHLPDVMPRHLGSGFSGRLSAAAAQQGCGQADAGFTSSGIANNGGSTSSSSKVAVFESLLAQPREPSRRRQGGRWGRRRIVVSSSSVVAAPEGASSSSAAGAAGGREGGRGAE